MPAAPAGRPGAAAPTPLYTKLKPRPNGPGRERVARNQRARLHGATIEAVAARGDPAITVADVVSLAGVSRRTFYEHFADREACVMASCDAIVGGLARQVTEACRGASDPVGRLGLAFETVAREIAAEPKAARLAILDILAAGPVGLERMERTHALCERTIAQCLGESPEGVALPPAVARGIAGGIWQVVRRRLLEGRQEELPRIAGELLDWALACRSAAAAELLAEEPAVTGVPETPRPPGGEGLDEHRLILRTAAELAAREGYAQLSTGWIAHEAGVPEALLIERYGSDRGCFLAALELLTAEALAGALSEAQRASDWPTAVHRTIAGLMRHAARDRAFARIAFVEVFAAGPGCLERGARLLRGLSDLLARTAPHAERPSPLAAEAAVGGIWEIVRHQVARGTPQRLPGLAGCATYIALAPAIGGREAVRSIARA